MVREPPRWFHLPKVCGSLADDWRLEGGRYDKKLAFFHIFPMVGVECQSFVPWYLIIHSFGVLLLSFDSFSIHYFLRDVKRVPKEVNHETLAFCQCINSRRDGRNFINFVLLSDSITEKEDSSLLWCWQQFAGAHHIVMFNVKDGTTEDDFTALESALRGLKQILGQNKSKSLE